MEEQEVLLDRTRASELGKETVNLLRAGYYRTVTGQVVEIHELIRRAVEGTCSYPPDQQLPDSHLGERKTLFEVINETTLRSTRRLAESGLRPAALNFASAKHPGGGFRSGARAQEESLARSSGLFACLEGNEMYSYHHALRDSLYSSYAIYSPNVPVFRLDDGTLLEQPYLCAFITAPAVNAKAVLRHNLTRQDEIHQAMWVRILRVLAIAVEHGHQTLVLGAWGGGAFGNDCEIIAQLFGKALKERFAGAFERVIFAVTDWSEDQHFIGPFRRVFGPPAG